MGIRRGRTSKRRIEVEDSLRAKPACGGINIADTPTAESIIGMCLAAVDF